jgi:polar amino acid transport system substrate-binding protein
MKYILYGLFAFFTWLNPVYAAEGDPLIVGVETFIPPFVLQGANKGLYGFDIDMMTEICKIMKRTCQFRVMRFDRLLDAVASSEIDVAISAITVTADRAAKVNFSAPYLTSHSRFLTKKTAKPVPFNLSSLNNKTIGIEAGSIFAQQIQAMGIKNATIRENPKVAALLEDLENGKVDFIIVDNQTAIYWEANSSDRFVLHGPPYEYGYGFAIAVNPADESLLTAINQALITYQKSEAYKRDYKRYLSQF